MKLTNGAQILAATARDVNNNIFLLAFGIAGKEDIHSWKWFCQRLHETIGEVGEHGPWVIMSDRQKVKLYTCMCIAVDMRTLVSYNTHIPISGTP